MPPLDHKPMSIDVEVDSFDTDEAEVPVLSRNTSIKSCLRKTTDDRSDRTDTKMKRSLQFHDSTTILWIEGIDCMSDEEIDNCYYDARDYNGFRDRERRMQRNFSNWGFMKTKTVRKGDYLGVETRLQRFHRRQRTKNAVFAVLLEQELQTEKGVGDDSLIQEDVAIARAYQQHTKESARLARERATLNAAQVDKTKSSVLRASRTYVDEVEMDKGEENSHATTTKIELPWEVPASNKTHLNKNRPADMIKYSTCAYLPSNYLDALHCKEPNVLQKPSQSFHYLHHRNRRMLHGGDGQEAPVEQKMIRNPEHYQFRNVMLHPHPQSQHPMTTEQNYSVAAPQQWTWNQIPYNFVPPANVPTLLARDVH